MADVTLNGTYIRALGRRKTAVAQTRVYLQGSGQFLVNGKDARDYFGATEWQNRILAPLKAVGMAETADVSVKVIGGGIASQADAVSLGIARALIKSNEELRPTLKAEGLLTRDSRKKERKKPGLKKARKAPQWSKR